MVCIGKWPSFQISAWILFYLEKWISSGLVRRCICFACLYTSAEYATLEGIDRYHQQHFGDPLGAEYHFVIHNGKKQPIGLIEAAHWRYQEYAAHLFHPERAPYSCAICLIGDFEKR